MIQILDRSGPNQHHDGWYTERIFGVADHPIKVDEMLLSGQIPIPYGLDPDPIDSDVRPSLYKEGRFYFCVTYVAQTY